MFLHKNITNDLTWAMRYVEQERTHLGQISTIQGREILAITIVQNSASANNDANSEYTKTKNWYLNNLLHASKMYNK